MNISLDWLAIGLATLSTMVVGTIWYRPAVFGRRWQALTGKDPNAPANKGLAYGGSFLASAVTAVVLAAATDVAGRDLDLEPLPAALLAAAALWLGFTAARMLVHDLFASRDLRIWLLDTCYELATVLVMAVIIGLLG
ncbi:DUF1761 domain-containing protein [Jiangella anatolica]|uniref:DUF1761 domain-containing protein n=1 Tax=Jiangella anatolica TaxID=2670374 RepID=A0A2W2B1D5_9ACTN|nr:DUF1761 domain-containing protein [Jiangella anatolica]PZF81251.1 DUF1761 domain-containing protein [Jiangella anatolica]